MTAPQTWSTDVRLRGAGALVGARWELDVLDRHLCHVCIADPVPSRPFDDLAWPFAAGAPISPAEAAARRISLTASR